MRSAILAPRCMNQCFIMWLRPNTRREKLCRASFAVMSTFRLWLTAFARVTSASVLGQASSVRLPGTFSFRQGACIS